jgi:hypothetical protein
MPDVPSMTRLECILLLKEIALDHQVSAEARDLAVNIFDKNSHSMKYKDSRLLVVTCIVIASKLLDVVYVHMVAFNDLYSTDDITACEYDMLTLMRFDIKPSSTPSFLAQHLVRGWSGSTGYAHLSEALEMLIGKFHEAQDSTAYSPIVTAVTSVLLAIGKVYSDVARRLALQQEFLLFLQCFMQHTGYAVERTAFPMFMSKYDDYSKLGAHIERCLKTFQDISYISPTRGSPVSVDFIDSRHGPTAPESFLESDSSGQASKKRARIMFDPRDASHEVELPRAEDSL